MQQHAEPVGGAQAAALAARSAASPAAHRPDRRQWRDWAAAQYRWRDRAARAMPSVVVLTSSVASASASFNSFPGRRRANVRGSARAKLRRGRRAVDHHDARRRRASADHRSRRAPRRRRRARPRCRARGPNAARRHRDCPKSLRRRYWSSKQPPSSHSVLAAPTARARSSGCDKASAALLVRHRDIGADIAARGERLHEGSEFFRRHRLAAVFAGDAVAFEPVIMNQRRARMFDRPADDASGADAPRSRLIHHGIAQARRSPGTRPR